MPQTSKVLLSSINNKGGAISYAQAVSSSSLDGQPPKKKGSRMTMSSTSSDQPRGGTKIAEAKRPRSSKSLTCGRCFRTSHSTAECKHQVVCLRCSGVEHLAACYPGGLRHSLQRKQLYVRSKLLKGSAGYSEIVQPGALTATVGGRTARRVEISSSNN